MIAAAPVRHLSLGVSFVESLPSGHPARQAAAQAETGFVAGILSPTELLIEGPDVASRQAQLSRRPTLGLTRVVDASRVDVD